MTTDAPQLATTATDCEVWRVGFQPEPWAWPSWQHATQGRFPGRWDDADGNFRTIYAGTRLLSCLLEVLACFRADPHLADQLTDIIDDDDHVGTYPTIPAGTVPRSWMQPRTAASAHLTGTYAAITNAESIAFLRPEFLHRAQQLGLDDLDAAVLKDARPRTLTQQVSSYIYETTDLDGVQFHSRHGDDHTLWAVFERPGDPDVSPHLHDPTPQPSLRTSRSSWTPSASTTSPGPTARPDKSVRTKRPIRTSAHPTSQPGVPAESHMLMTTLVSALTGLNRTGSSGGCGLSRV
jgi:hypothetical protein